MKHQTKQSRKQESKQQRRDTWQAKRSLRILMTVDTTSIITRYRRRYLSAAHNATAARGILLNDICLVDQKRRKKGNYSQFTAQVPTNYCYPFSHQRNIYKLKITTRHTTHVDYKLRIVTVASKNQWLIIIYWRTLM